MRAYLNSERLTECIWPSRVDQHKPSSTNTGWAFNQRMWKSLCNLFYTWLFLEREKIDSDKFTIWPFLVREKNKKGEFKGSAQAASASRQEPFVLMMSQSTDYLQIFRWGMLKGIWWVSDSKSNKKTPQVVLINDYCTASKYWSPGCSGFSV